MMEMPGHDRLLIGQRIILELVISAKLDSLQRVIWVDQR